jgi:hypothetical protein
MGFLDLRNLDLIYIYFFVRYWSQDFRLHGMAENLKFKGCNLGFERVQGEQSVGEQKESRRHSPKYIYLNIYI